MTLQVGASLASVLKTALHDDTRGRFQGGPEGPPRRRLGTAHLRSWPGAPGRLARVLAALVKHNLTARS
jgi:hypothetical protein